MEPVAALCRSHSRLCVGEQTMVDVSDEVGGTSRGASRTNPLVTAGFIAVAIVALYVGAGIFVPLVLAVLLAFALAPLVNALRRVHFPHIVAVIVTVASAGVLLAVIGYVVATQLVKLAADLPSYQTTVATKLEGLHAWLGGSNFLDRLGTAVDQLKAQVTTPSNNTLPGNGASPVPVTIANSPDNPLGMVSAILGSVLGPLATAAIVVVFLVFLLLERMDLRDRFLKLVSRGDLRTSTKAIDEAGARVGRYLLVQFSVNLSYGVILGLGLTLIGVPNGILWGLLATLFRYIPFVGTLIVAMIPFTLAFAVDPGWSMLLKTVALYVVLETTATNIVEPRLYGSSTGLSALAVLIAAMFWATLWGPIGLILATPLTVCLVVIGRYVPQLQFLETLLGSEPVLSPEERFYQRLVAGNTEEAIDVAEHEVGANDPTQFYELVAIPALRLAEADLAVDAADLIQRRRLVESLNEVIDELEQEIDVGEEGARYVVVGGRTELDAVAARIVASTVRRSGVAVRVLPPISVRREALGQLDLAGVDTICLVYVGSQTRSYARFVVRRLRRLYPGLEIVLCLLGKTPDLEATMADTLSANAVATSLAQTVQALQASSRVVTEAAELPPPSPKGERARLRLTVGTSDKVAAFLRSVADRFEVAVALATIADADDVAVATREHTLAGDRLHGSRHLMDRVVATGEVVVVTDAFKDKEFAADPFLLESGVKFYAGAPLKDESDQVIGVLAIMDETVRDLNDEDRLQLTNLAGELMTLAAEVEMPEPVA